MNYDKQNEKMLLTWEGKMYGPTKENGKWGIKTNSELVTKYKSCYCYKDFKIGMAWARY
jgi:hypothetical protein